MHLAARFEKIESALEKIRSITDDNEIIDIIDAVLKEEELE